MEVIGLVCLTTCNTTATSIHSIYDDAIAAGVIISTGSAASSPANERESVLKWLSDGSANSRTTDNSIVKSKYFISKQGRLYAQPGASISLDERMIETLVRAKVPGETN